MNDVRESPKNAEAKQNAEEWRKVRDGLEGGDQQQFPRPMKNMALAQLWNRGAAGFACTLRKWTFDPAIGGPPD